MFIDFRSLLFLSMASRVVHRSKTDLNSFWYVSFWFIGFFHADLSYVNGLHTSVNRFDHQHFLFKMKSRKRTKTSWVFFFVSFTMKAWVVASWKWRQLAKSVGLSPRAPCYISSEIFHQFIKAYWKRLRPYPLFDLFTGWAHSTLSLSGWMSLFSGDTTIPMITFCVNVRGKPFISPCVSVSVR